MATVLSIVNNVVTIGTDDGRIIELPLENFVFVPSEGDEVYVYENERQTTIEKVETNDFNDERVEVDKLTYCLLCLFLGWIGIHKFYVNKFTLGLLYLLFSWTSIPAIIAFIEFILALCKKADANGMILV